MPFIDTKSLGIFGTLLAWLHGSREGAALVPHCDQTIVGLPHGLSVNYASCARLQALSPNTLPSPSGVLDGVTSGHLMKVYDGTMLCPRDLLMLDCAFMDSQKYFFPRAEVSE